MHCINFAWYNKKGGKKIIRGPCPPQSYLPLTFPTLINMSTLGNPVDTGRKLNVHKTFRRRPGQRLMYVQFTSCDYWDVSFSENSILNGYPKSRKSEKYYSKFSHFRVFNFALQQISKTQIIKRIGKYFRDFQVFRVFDLA